MAKLRNGLIFEDLRGDSLRFGSIHRAVGECGKSKAVLRDEMEYRLLGGGCVRELEWRCLL